MGIYSEHWRSYYDLGLLPIPVEKGSKKLEVAWGEIYDKPPDTTEIFQEWAEKFSDANIAVAIGEKWAVVDPDGPEAETYTESLDLPGCPISNSSNRSVIGGSKTPSRFRRSLCLWGRTAASLKSSPGNT